MRASVSNYSQFGVLTYVCANSLIAIELLHNYALI